MQKDVNREILSFIMESHPLKPVYFPFTCSCPQAAANQHSSDILFGALVLPR